LKLTFPLPPPRRDDGSLLPALLSAVLVIAAGAQLSLASAVDLPSVAVVPPPRPAVLPALPPAALVPAPLLARAMFTPSRLPTADAPSTPLDGAVIEGAVRTRGHAHIIVRLSDGHIRNMAPGDVVAGWRLLSIGDGAALMSRGGERRRFPFGASAAPADNSGQTEEDAQ